MINVVPRLTSAAVGLTACLVAVNATAQPQDRVRLSLREVSAESLFCALNVASNSMVGEALLTCGSSDPSSHLGAHRPLSTSEAARLFALVEQMPMQPHLPGAEWSMRTIGPKANLVIGRRAESVTVDVSRGPQGLSDDEREIWQMLRAIADELRGMKR